MNGTKYIFIMAALALAPLQGAAAAGQPEVSHLGTNNTLVRVPSEGRFIMMPVQESNEDATVNVLVDGRLDRTLYLRLAKTKIDYSVPFDLTPYAGHDVVLNIVTSQNRSSLREAKEDICWRNFSMTDAPDLANREAFRPRYHHSPLYGWMNDPNGMFFKDGRWHLYYQWNPYGSKWQNMTWGHSSSADLIHWDHHPAAIEPDGLGSVFSGSAAVDATGSAGFGKDAVVALYTSAGVSQVQSLAFSTDNGESFSIFSGNPVLTLESEAMDPNMFRDPETGRWILVLAHPLEHEMLFFSSADMKSWTPESSFGKGLGVQDGVWECPDLFRLPVEGTGEEKWVLLCNINPGGPFGGSATQYFTGEFDGHRFIPDTDASGNVPVKWLDFGKDNYATVSWSDAPQGRRTVIGWMSNWQYAAEVPTSQFRSANTLPRDLSLFMAPDGLCYLKSAPSPELLALRGKAALKGVKARLGAKGKVFSLPADCQGACEITLDVDPAKSRMVRLDLSNDLGEYVALSFDPSARTLSFDRRHSGMTDFSQDFPAVTTAPLLSGTSKLSLRIFVDAASIEVFADNGEAVMTNIVFPNSPYSKLSLFSEGGTAGISNLNVYPISSCSN